MNYKIIAISRQFGSGGRTVGKELAAKLGVACYDQELIELLANKSGFSAEHIAELNEERSKGSIIPGMADRVERALQHSLWQSQRDVILDLAEKESCVIVGRCADYILRDRADVLRVYIHADKDKRAKRIVEVYGERDDTPLKRINDKDKRRESYYETYTTNKWGDAENYHITLDSGELGIDTCVKLLEILC
ncbi:MAG: cytidylate kinase-like family protein [Oscillospiraceae bacterium]|nr:cytidylate kinase-like family protein [Oscillospiraceae bacterium]